MPIRRLVPILLLQASFLFGQQPQQQGELDVSPALFSVLAAINVAGYDVDLDSASTPPIRKQIRDAILAKHLPVVDELKRFYSAHHQSSATGELSQYISFALSVDAPPSFEYRFKPELLPPDVKDLEALQPLLIRFYRDADLEELWKRSQPAFDQLLEQYHEPVTRAIMEVNAYLRNSTSSPTDRRFQIYLDLLAAPNQVQTRIYNGDYFIVATPSTDPQVDDIRHVYLQYLLDPMAMRHGELWEQRKGLGDFAQPAPLLSEHYKQDFTLLASASLVRAVEVRLAPASRRAEMVDQALREGFILTPYFAEKLPEYEKQEQSMRLYYSELVQGIDLKREDKRLENVQFATEQAVRKAKPAARSPEPQLSAGAKTLADAERLYTARELEQARETYLRVLEQAGEKPLHAKAYYGLARIAAIKNDPELAVRLFQKTLESEPEPQEKAWSMVYLARLAEAAGRSAEQAGRPEEAARERDQAIRQYRAVLTVPGASDAARQAAQQGLASAEKSRP